MTQPTTAWSQIFVADDETGETLVPIGSGHCIPFTRRAPDKQSSNEDGALTLGVDADRGLLAVADGMGGAPGGERAAKLALTTLARSVHECAAAGGELRHGIVDGFDAANRAVVELGIGAATTLVAVELDGVRARSYHVGDSGALIVGQRGRLKHATVPHSPVGYAVEAGVIDEEQAIEHEDRHVVSNAIGNSDMKLEIGPTLELARYDTVVLASDGLWDNLRLDEVVDTVRTGSLPRVVGVLGKLATDRMSGDDATHPGKTDDLTFIVYRRRPGGVRV